MKTLVTALFLALFSAPAFARPASEGDKGLYEGFRTVLSGEACRDVPRETFFERHLWFTLFTRQTIVIEPDGILESTWNDVDHVSVTLDFRNGTARYLFGKLDETDCREDREACEKLLGKFVRYLRRMKNVDYGDVDWATGESIRASLSCAEALAQSYLDFLLRTDTGSSN